MAPDPSQSPEERAIAAENLIRLIFRTVGDVLFYLSVEEGEVFRFRAVNEAFLNATGLKEDQIIGRRVEEVIPPPSLKLALASYRLAIQQNRTVRWDENSTYPVGSRYGEVSITPVRSGAKTEGLVGAVHGITERKESESRIFKTLSILKAIVEGTTDAIFIKDTQGRYTMINAAGARLLGKNPEEVIGRRDRDLMALDAAECVRKSDEDVLRAGEVRTFEESLNLSGVPLTFRATKGPFRDAAGAIIGVFGIMRDISSLKRDKAELERLLSLQRATLEATADGILVIDQSGDIVQYNQRLIDIWKIPRWAVEGRNYREALGFVLDLLENPMECTVRLDEICRDTERDTYDLLRFKDGSAFERYSRPQKLDGRTIGRVFSYRDVSERIRSAAALRDSEVRKSAMLDTALDAIISADGNGKITEFNRAAEETLGYKRDFAVGKNIEEILVPPRHQAEFRAEIRKYQLTGKSWVLGRRVEFIAMKNGGAEFPAEASVVHVPLAGPITFTGFVRDISDRRQMEKNTRESAARLKVLAEFAGAVAEAKFELGLVLNKAAQLLAEYFRDGCIVRLFSKDSTNLEARAFHHVEADAKAEIGRILPADRALIDPEGVSEALRRGAGIRVAATPAEARERFSGAHSDFFDRFPVHSWLIVPLHAVSGVVGFITVFRTRTAAPYSAQELEFLEDVCTRIALAVQNARLFNEAQEAIRIRDDFILTASHQLKTPLTPLKLQLELLNRAIATGLITFDKKGVELKELLGDTYHNVGKLVRLVDEMLDLGRLSTETVRKTVDVNLSLLVGEVLSSHRKLLQGCKVLLDADPNVHGQWDQLRLEQVIVNLLTNAAKYGAGHPIHIRVAAESGKAVLAVRDFGIGMSKSDLERIFQRFGRAVSIKRFEGLGLGLFITKQIVEAHGGTIEVESAPERGSTFTVRLPLGANARVAA